MKHPFERFQLQAFLIEALKEKILKNQPKFKNGSF